MQNCIHTCMQALSVFRFKEKEIMSLDTDELVRLYAYVYVYVCNVCLYVCMYICVS